MENYIGKVCPFCKTEITENDTVKVCPDCDIPHHESCWKENAGCTTFGCAQQNSEVQPVAPVAPVVSAAPVASGVFCPTCGTPLSDEQAFCPKCGTAKPAAPIKNICSNCGYELQAGQEFCPRCGNRAAFAAAPMAAGYYPTNVNAQANTKKKKLLPIIIAAVAVIGVILAFILFGSKGGPTVDEILLSKSSVTLRVDDTTSVSYTITPEKSSDVDVTWKSSNKSVATVDKYGKITAVGEGSCRITASAGGKSDSIEVEVIAMRREEKMVLGTWKIYGFMDDSGDFNSISSSSGEFCTYSDFSGKMRAGDTTLYFTWEYSKYSEEMYFFNGTTTDGGTFTFVLTELNGEDTILSLIGDLMVVYQK